MEQLFDIIPETPQQRLKKEVLDILKSGDFIFDTHTHIFGMEYLPEKYFSLRLPYIVDTEFLMYVNENLREEFLGEDNLLYFIKYYKFLKKNNSEQIARFLIENSPPNTIFALITMDFTGIDPKPPKSFATQIEETKKIIDLFPNKFIPFFSINPKNISNPLMLPRVFSKPYNFFGVALYPSLGYMPSHPTLMKLYEVFEKKRIPVITNSSYSNIHTTRNLHKLLYWDYDSEKQKFKLKKQTKIFWFKKQYIKFFNNPDNWRPILKKHPNLYLNFTHSGGIEAWEDEKNCDTWLCSIIDLMERYPNVYADISYLIGYENFAQKFLDLYHRNKIFADRVMFGTDFHFVMIEGFYNILRSRFVNTIGSEIMNKISRINPLKFLSLEAFI